MPKQTKQHSNRTQIKFYENIYFNPHVKKKRVKSNFLLNSRVKSGNWKQFHQSFFLNFSRASTGNQEEKTTYLMNKQGKGKFIIFKFYAEKGNAKNIYSNQ